MSDDVLRATLQNVAFRAEEEANRALILSQRPSSTAGIFSMLLTLDNISTIWDPFQRIIEDENVALNQEGDMKEAWDTLVAAHGIVAEASAAILKCLQDQNGTYKSAVLARRLAHHCNLCDMTEQRVRRFYDMVDEWPADDRMT